MAFGDFTVTRASTKNVLGSNGLYQSVANDTPAFEFNTDGTYRGLLVEPGATNSIRNNSMTGAVAGTPGTLPTNWSDVALAGLTRQVVGTGTELGVNYIDIRFSGTTSSTSVGTFFETSTNITATLGQTWTFSAWLKLQASVAFPAGTFNIGFEERDSGGSFLANQTDVVTVGSSLSRVSFTGTTANASVARIRPLFRISSMTNGASYDFTIRIGWPQAETGPIATSPIVTTGSTATRSADNITLTSASSLIGQSANTLYIEGEIRTVTGASDACLFALTDGTNAEAIVVRTIAANGRIGAVVRDGGSNQAEITSASFTTGLFKCAIASAVNDVAFYLNGSSVGTDASATHPAMSQFQFGGTVATVAPTARTAWFRAIAIYTTRLSNAQLASLTT